MDTFKERLSELMKNRLFVLLVIVAAIFAVLVCRLFYMQIVNGEEASAGITSSVTREVSMPAARGNIYDRYGRPLAVNEAAFSIEIDDSIAVDYEDKNEQVVKLYEKMKENGYTVTDNLPISRDTEPKFTISGDELEEWKTDIGLDKKQMRYDAARTLEYLYDSYGLDETVDENKKREIVSLGINISDKNIMIMNLIMTIESNGGEIVDELPISEDRPYTFIIENEKEIQRWKKDVSMEGEELDYTAEESMEYLIDLFGIPQNMSPAMQRKLAAVRYSLYLQRFKKYQPVTVAREINDKIIAEVKENLDIFPGVSVETESMRKYEEGDKFSNILGYIRQISDEELKEYEQYGYDSGDIVGKTGIEKVMELELNGKDGKMLVEVDNMGRKISTLETEAPVSGNDVFLTIDKDLQIAAYNYLEDALAEAIITRLTSELEKDVPVTLKQLFTSMIESGSISVSSIMKAEEGYQLTLKNLILSYNKDIDISDSEQKTAAKQVLTKAVEDGTLSYTTMIFVMLEQGIITADDNYRSRIVSGELSPLEIIIDKLRTGDLTPAETNLNPCSGS
ncbi:MAG: hypothetical protein ACLRQB_02660, partial [Christensenellales bacterium]